MKLKNWMLPLTLIAVLFLAGACKKDSEVESKSLTGSLSLAMPAFLEVGSTVTIDVDALMTLSCADNLPIGYYFTNPSTEKRDTVVNADGTVLSHSYTVTAADVLETQTLTLTAFVSNSNYTNQSATASFTIVRPGFDGAGSITRYNAVPTTGTFTDARDGKTYDYITIGDLDWMRQNLSWADAGVPYWNCEVMGDIFGRYYSWEEAQSACPEGWRLPGDIDWTGLQDGSEAGKNVPGLASRMMADLYFNGERMWGYWRAVNITDALGFSAMPAGYVNVGDGATTFQGIYSYAAFWTSDESGEQAVCRYINDSKDILYRGNMSKTDFAASVRCVRNR